MRLPAYILRLLVTGCVLAGCLGLAAEQGPAQPRHRLLKDGAGFQLETIATGRKRPFDMWVIRLANAAFHSDYTDAVIANLDDYQRYGLNTIVVGLQGGQSESAPYPRVYNTDGTLDLTSPVWANMKRLLEETDKRGMVLMMQYWYFLRDERVPDDAKALLATANATGWLKGTGYRHVCLDIANEFEHGAYGSRPLFSTLTGALQLIDAVRAVDPDLLIGISPPTRIFWPAGSIGTPARKVEADFLIAHNVVQDRSLIGAYRLGSVPSNPAAWPYVNNEFWSQIPYERTKFTNPRTMLLDYGHFIAKNTDLYIAELNKLRGFGGFGNVHCRRLQQVVSGQTTPVAEIGPEGTQPEATPGGGEPSVHWLFRGIARIRNYGPLSARHDYNAGYAAGHERDPFFAGTWVLEEGCLKQTDAAAATAFTRLVADAGDIEIAFDGGFDKTSGSASRFGIQVGDASPAGPAWRLRVAPTTVTLDKVGAAFTAVSVPSTSRHQDQYRLRLAGGRVQVLVNGVQRIDLADTSPISSRNVLLLTESAAARFDNVRFTPLRDVDFDDGKTGDWIGDGNWSLVARGSGKAWRALVPAATVGRAHLPWRVQDFALGFVVDASAGSGVGIDFRSADASAALAYGYHLDVTPTGKCRLTRTDEVGTTSLGDGQALNVNAAAMRIDVHVTDLDVTGAHIAVRVDGAVVLDVIDAGAPLERGGIALTAASGTTVVDQVALAIGPDRFPIARFHPLAGPALPRGFAIEFGDPDGIIDVNGLSLAVDTGGGFVDISFVLIPWFSVFAHEFTADGRSLVFRLNAPAPLGPVNWTFRVTAVDRDGKVTIHDLKTSSP